MPDIYELSIKICNESNELSIDLLRRRLAGQYSVILGYRECAELIEDIKQLRKGKGNEN